MLKVMKIYGYDQNKRWKEEKPNMIDNALEFTHKFRSTLVKSKNMPM